MLRRRVLDLRRTALPMVVAAVLLSGSCVALSSASAAAATSAGRTLALSTNGQWPGVGKICEPGPGGASSVRGVGPRPSTSPCSTTPPTRSSQDSKSSSLQQAKAFAAWCNASGGINGRHIVIDDRDAALFNAAQQTEQACQSDFMSVGWRHGARPARRPDSRAVRARPDQRLRRLRRLRSRLACRSTRAASAPSSVSSGWFGALTKKYPQAVKKAGMGGANTPSVLEPERKFEFGAQGQGWNVVDFQEPPVTVTDWAPYVEEAQTKGVQALWPSATANMTPYFQAMTTAGYKPAFVALGDAVLQRHDRPRASPRTPASRRSTSRRDGGRSRWRRRAPPRSSSSTSCTPTGRVTPVNFFDEEGAESWLLWAKSASACGANLTVSCVLNHAAAEKNWSAGGIEAPVAQLTLSNQNPQPSPCFAILRAEPNKFVYDKAVTQPTQSIWNCNPKNIVHLTAQQQQQLASL